MNIAVVKRHLLIHSDYAGRSCKRATVGACPVEFSRSLGATSVGGLD